MKKLIDKINNWGKKKECALNMIYWCEMNAIIAILFFKSQNYIGMTIFGIIALVFALLSIPLFMYEGKD